MERAMHDPEGLERELRQIHAELAGGELVDHESAVQIRTLNRFLRSARNTLRSIIRESRDPKAKLLAEKGLKLSGQPRRR